MANSAKVAQRLASLPSLGGYEEERAPSCCLLVRDGRLSVVEASSSSLDRMGLRVYPHYHLTTQHALAVTRTLATLHAHACCANAAGGELTSSAADSVNTKEVKAVVEMSKCPAKGGSQGKIKCFIEEELEEECNGECGDRLTNEITNVDICQSNISILRHLLANKRENTQIVRKLATLDDDLSTLVDFMKFSSAVCKKWVASVGAISMCDIWVGGEDCDTSTLAIRLRGGRSLRAPPLRDAAWTWLTLMDPTNLRERYTELCNEYCSAFNLEYHRLITGSIGAGADVEEVLSYFDVMRDLGESFLHAFFTFVHKLVLSHTWCLDRGLHKANADQRIVPVLEFLIDNGIIGAIFVA